MQTRETDWRGSALRQISLRSGGASRFVEPRWPREYLPRCGAIDLVAPGAGLV
jgi:hypothetical protein